MMVGRTPEYEGNGFVICPEVELLGRIQDLRAIWLTESRCGIPEETFVICNFSEDVIKSLKEDNIVLASSNHGNYNLYYYHETYQMTIVAKVEMALSIQDLR